MPRVPLAQMAARAGTKRKVITFRPILTTRAQATTLAAISHRILAPWYAARQRIEEAYAREMARVLQTDSIDDLTGLLSDIADEVSRLVLELTPALKNWAFTTERWHRDKWRGTVLAGANVDLSYTIGPQDATETIDAFLARNTALVRDVGKQAEGRIADAVFRGFQARRPPREVGREISDTVGMARQRANRIAADQAVKLASALDAQRQREAGLSIWKWKHSGKLHPRPWHLARDSNLYADDKADQGPLPNGDVVMEPPEDTDLPGVPPFCGCVRQGVLVLDGEVLG